MQRLIRLRSKLTHGVRTAILGVALCNGIASAQVGLFFSEDSTSNGLWQLDPSDGTPTLIGASGVVSSTGGLSPADTRSTLYGTKPWTLLSINSDGTGVTDLGGATNEGLAYDPFHGVLYGIRNGDFRTLDPNTGAILTNLASPNLDIEGIAFDIRRRVIWGVVSKVVRDTFLYCYDPVTDQWTAVFETGVIWRSAGLAHDPMTDRLYVKGTQDSYLYEIDLARETTVHVGDTGLSAGGGLAYVPAIGLTANAVQFVSGDTASLLSYGGVPGGRTMLVAVDVNGASFFIPVAAGTYDGTGRWAISAPVTPSLTGLTVGLVSIGTFPAGRANLSNVLSLAFQ